MTRRYAVVGNPVSHSLSPLMHAGWLADHNVDADYIALKLESADPIGAIRNLGAQGFSGVNVTVPYKEAAAAAADFGAFTVANTLCWDERGAIWAYNTDGDGFIDALTEVVPDWRARVAKALILGAGGAAGGILQALRVSSDHNIEFVIANRTRTRAEMLADNTERTLVGDWNDLGSLFASADIIVQTTTLGMNGNESPDWPVERCKPDAVIVDIVYRPLETPLLKAARARGLTAVDGLGMLIHQGARAFEIWFGIKPDTEKARARLLAALS
jgi:shikimate dehydrogenase